MSKPLKLVLIIVIGLVVLAAGFFIYLMWEVGKPAAESATEQLFVVQPGEGSTDISHHLKETGLIRQPWIFQAYVLVEGVNSSLQAGDYLLKPNMTLREIARLLAAGEVVPREVTVKIVEGWNTQEMADYLAEKLAQYSSSFVSEEFKEDFLEMVEVKDSRKIIPDKNYEFLIDKSTSQGLEGYLFPDTYKIYKDSEPNQIIEKMLDNFEQKLTPELREEIKKQEKTIFEVITMASIVEKEVRTDEDRKKVADVFYKRLKEDIPLQSDATVNYVTGKSLLQPLIADTKVESPYNTYLNKGLPPGPICNPSLSSIQAAIYPEVNDYYYYLNKPDGTTVFSKTAEEHLENKAKYLD